MPTRRLECVAQRDDDRRPQASAGLGTPLRREHQRHTCYSNNRRIKKAYRCHKEFSCNARCNFQLRKTAGVQSITTTTSSFCLQTLALLKESHARDRTTEVKPPRVVMAGSFETVVVPEQKVQSPLSNRPIEGGVFKSGEIYPTHSFL